MADPRRRRERLLAVLPRIYSAQPASSAVGVMITSMAASLARLDDALTRVQYDRWVGLASPSQPAPDDTSALEGLGHLLQVSRLPPRVRHAGYTRSADCIELHFDHAATLADALDELVGSATPTDPASLLAAQFPGLRFTVADNSLATRADPEAPPEHTPAALARFQAVLDPEPGETFRQRLLVTAQVRTRGLTTPRALLSLAIADLGAEPCPRLMRSQDSTLAYGMPPGTRKRCAACTGSGSKICPNGDKAVIESWLTENPVLPATHSETAPRLRRVFTIPNPSLHPDRPVLTLKVREQPAAYPAVRSIDSGEITLFAGTLKPDETLTLYPAISTAEAAPYDGFDAPGHHAWRTAHPRGRAVLTSPDGHERDVSASIFYLWGNRFDDPSSTFGGLRCGVLDQRVQTPKLQCGENAWMLLTFAQPDAEFADNETNVHASRFAGPKDLDGTHFALLDGSIGQSDSRYASLLFESFSKTDTGSIGEESTANAPRLSLRLEWMTRPPAAFRLRIPKNAWVAAAARRGVLPLLRADVNRASAAGVGALVDFPEPTRRETAAPAEALGLSIRQDWSEDAAPGETGLEVRTNTALADAHDTAEGRFSIGAVFDTTRLDWSHAG